MNIDLHTHSIASGHALNTVYEMIEEANKKNISLLGIIEHGPSMEGAPHEGYFWISDKIEKKYKNVEVLLGVEANIINKNGDIDFKGPLLDKQKIVMACIHSKTPYKKTSTENNTLSLVNAMNNPFIKIISHPYRTNFKTDTERVVEAACATGTLLELNNQVFIEEINKPLFLENYKKMISLCKKNGIPLLLSSDAHLATRIGDFNKIISLKNKLGLTDDIIINNREKVLKLFLKSKKGSIKF
jgi:putative hydrolase